MTDNRYLVIMILLLAMVPGAVMAEETTMEMIGSKATDLAMDQLAFAEGDRNVLAMTDAGCAMYGTQTTEQCLNGITAQSGCTIGDSNLLIPQRSKFSPLWFFFYKKDTGNAVFIQVRPEVVSKSPSEIRNLASDQVFEIIAQERVNAEYILANQSVWTEARKNKIFGGNEFSLITIANMWADPDTPYDFLRAACFHNHLCPGVTSGYLLSHYVEEKLPLEKPGQKYKVIACPVWCKDDLFPVIWDATPGKRGIFVKDLSAAEKAGLRESLGTDVAGIYVRWDSETGRGDGMVLGYNWTESNVLAGTSDWQGDPVLSKLVMDLKLIDYTDRPEVVVSTIKTFTCESSDEFAALTQAGVNPLKVLGVEA